MSTMSTTTCNTEHDIPDGWFAAGTAVPNSTEYWINPFSGLIVCGPEAPPIRDIEVAQIPTEPRLLVVPEDQTEPTRDIATELAHCTGSDTTYRHSFMRWFEYTEGARTLAEMAGAYWLIDVVASHQIKPRVRREQFQLWSIRKLPPTAKNAAVVECRTDSNRPVLCKQFIPYTDFPFAALGDTFEWYVCRAERGPRMLLKSEY